MSDHIPLEIQMDIIQRFPDTKSLIQFRSVSKAWKTLIDSKDFVTAHTLRHQAHNRHLLIRTEADTFLVDDNRPQAKYLSIADDDTFPCQNHNVFVPDSLKKFHSVIGTSYGLFALFLYKPDTVVIWNPFIRKTVEIPVEIPVPNVSMSTVFGFGVCPRNLDPKLVKITFDSILQDGNTGTQVEVFSLSSGGTWRSPISSNVPHRSIRFRSCLHIDRFIYWVANDRFNVDGGFRKLIMSFDLTSEEFINVNLPDPLTHSEADLAILNLRDSLAVIEFEEWTEIIRVWQMIGHGCTRSFNKLYSINGYYESIHTIYAFRKSGAPIVDMEIDDEDSDHPVRGLAIYERESKSITNMGIQLLDGNSSVHSYMETLLLVAH